jgi:ADP-ribosylation factor-like protein 6
VEIAATVGFKVETFSKSKIDFTVFDMSGQGKYRSLWEKYYDESEVIYKKETTNYRLSFL